MLIIRHVRRTAVSRQQAAVSSQQSGVSPELSVFTRVDYNNGVVKGRGGKVGRQLIAESVVYYALL